MVEPKAHWPFWPVDDKPAQALPTAAAQSFPLVTAIEADNLQALASAAARWTGAVTA